MIEIIKRWLWPTQNKGTGYLPVAISDPLQERKLLEPPKYIRKPLEVQAARWSTDMWPTLLRGNLFPAATKLLPPLLGQTPGGDIDAAPFKIIPNGAWVIFCPTISRLWWISAADFANFYYKGDTIVQPKYIPAGSHWNNATHFAVIHARRKALHVHALPLGREGTVMQTLKELELRLNRGTSITVWENKIRTTPGQDAWVVVDVHNYAWAVEADVFDALYKGVD